MKDGKYCVGIVGLGFIGKVHAIAYASIRNEVQILAAADYVPQSRENIQKEFNIPHVFEDYRTLLELEELDAISICTPNFLHKPIALAALDRGLHVLCEKPMATTLADAEEIAAKVRESGNLFMVGQNNRRDERSLKLKHWIDTGYMGEIYHIDCSWLRQRFISMLTPWFGDKSKSGGGPLIDLGVHLLDLSLWFMGFPKVTAVSGATYANFADELGQGGDFTVEDFATGFIRTEKNSTISLTSSWACYTEQRDFSQIRIYGNRGGALWNPLRLMNSDGNLLLDTQIANPNSMAWQKAVNDQMKYWIACIRNCVQPKPGIEEGLSVMRVLDAIYRSANDGREIVLK